MTPRSRGSQKQKGWSGIGIMFFLVLFLDASCTVKYSSGVKIITGPAYLDPTRLAELNQRLLGVEVAAHIATPLELNLVKRGRFSALHRNSIGSPEFTHCAYLALAEGVPVEGVIANRKERVPLAVSGALRSGAIGVVEGFRTGHANSASPARPRLLLSLA